MEECDIGVLTGDEVLMMGFIGMIPWGCQMVLTSLTGAGGSGGVSCDGAVGLCG